MRSSTSFNAASVWARRFADSLALAFINDDGDNVCQLVALIGVEHGVGKGGQQEGKACDAQGPAATVEIDERSSEGDAHGAGGPEQGPADEGQEGDVPGRSLVEPFEQGRHVDLVSLVVARQGIHDDVDAGTEGEFALAVGAADKSVQRFLRCR